MTPLEPTSAPGHAKADWRKPRESPGLVRYAETIRERIWLVVGITALTLAAAAAYLAVTPKVYDAQAELLVSPISNSEPALTGLSLVRASSDPTRDVETVARLVTSRDVAVRAKRELGLDQSVTELMNHTEASPVAQSNVVVITAEADSPREAAQVANGFAESSVADRNEKLRTQLKPMIETLRERIAAESRLPASPGVAEELARLEDLKVAGDPTVRFETRAVPPESAATPRPVLTIVAGLIGGLVLGVGAAFLIRAMDPRLRREEQLREHYRLPILARIPRERGRPDRGRRRPEREAPAEPFWLSPQMLEAYRTLRTMLGAAVPDVEDTNGPGRAILITGPSSVEGKTTTAINLAYSYVCAGKRVVLVEADFHRPRVATTFKVRGHVGVGELLVGEASLSDALVPIEPFGDHLRLLPVHRPDMGLSEMLSMPAARRLLNQVRAVADYVIVDSPPLAEVIDALPLARCVDDVVLVCRLGTSSLSQLSRLADLLEQNQIEPRGFVVVGVAGPKRGGYYFPGDQDRDGQARWAELQQQRVGEQAGSGRRVAEP
jgi:capsular exopolysaccharide synthesis family protein